MSVPCAVYAAIDVNQLLLSNGQMELRVWFVLQTVDLPEHIAQHVLTQFFLKSDNCRFIKIDPLA